MLCPLIASAAVDVPAPDKKCLAGVVSLTSVHEVPFHNSVLPELADPLGEPPKKSIAVASPQEAAHKRSSFKSLTSVQPLPFHNSVPPPLLSTASAAVCVPSAFAYCLSEFVSVVSVQDVPLYCS